MPNEDVLKSTFKNTALFLTIWLVVIAGLSVGAILIGHIQICLVGALHLQVCAVLIISIHASSIVFKWMGFWIFVVISCIDNCVLIFKFLRGNRISTISGKGMDNNWYSREMTIILCVAIIYFILSIFSAMLYWNHCDAATKIMKLTKCAGDDIEGSAKLNGKCVKHLPTLEIKSSSFKEGSNSQV